MTTVIVIPARMQSTRFPGKPLADIHGKPMIIHVMERAQQSGLGDVFVACCEEEVAQVVRKHGGQAVMTKIDHPSGTDRIFEAVEHLGLQDDDVVVNVQGDLPLLQPEVITRARLLLDNPQVEISTLAAVITRQSEITNPNVVKAVIALPNSQKEVLDQSGRALYFTRATAPYGDGDLYHHIGLYAYRYHGLRKFVALPPSSLELREKLEQLRVLEAGMRIDVAVVDHIPLGVDTPEDLEIVKQQMEILGE